MQTFKYTAKSRDGARVNGVIEASDKFAAVERIRNDYPVVLKIDEVKTGGIWDALNADAFSGKVDEKALSILCNQFSIILSSGVVIDQCLQLLAAQTADKKLKKMLEASSKDVATGEPLADALQKNYPQLPVLFVESVRAGEAAGTLPQTFDSLSEYYRKGDEVNKKIRSSLRYPIFVLAVAVVVLIIVMTRVMPVFVHMFDDFDGELPVMTQIMIGLSNWFSKGWLIIVAVIAAIVVVIELFKHGHDGKLRWANLQLKMPMGKIRLLQACQQFANSMSSLMGAGLTVANALEVTSKCLDNYAIATEVRSYVEKVQTGFSLSEVIHQSRYFPPVMQEMVGVGERTGELVKTLDTVSAYYTQEADYETQKALSKIEPAMLIVIAVIAGFVVISIYLPMFTMYNYM